MLRVVAFGLCVGVGVQALRAWPASAPVSGSAIALVMCIAAVAAYLAGRFHGRPGGAAAVAAAEASAAAEATAQQSVQVFVGTSPVSSGAGVRIPSDHAPWIEGGQRPELTLDHLDGLAVEELLEEDMTRVRDDW